MLPNFNVASDEEENYDFDEFDDDEDGEDVINEKERDNTSAHVAKSKKSNKLKQKEATDYQKVARHYESKFNKKLN